VSPLLLSCQAFPPSSIKEGQEYVLLFGHQTAFQTCSLQRIPSRTLMDGISLSFQIGNVMISSNLVETNHIITAVSFAEIRSQSSSFCFVCFADVLVAHFLNLLLDFDIYCVLTYHMEIINHWHPRGEIVFIRFDIGHFNRPKLMLLFSSHNFIPPPQIMPDPVP